MAQPVTKWQGANGNLFDTEAEADRSLVDQADLRQLTAWIARHTDIHDNTTPEEIAVAVLRGFDIRPRAPGFDPRERMLAVLHATHWPSMSPEDVVSDLLEKFHVTPRLS